MKFTHIAVLVLLFVTALSAAKTLDMYVVDVEGGKAVLLVSPSGESMLIDAGSRGNNDRDATRIVEACKAAGLKQIDFMVVSHYDGDHVSDVPTLAGMFPLVTFVDHGENVQINEGTVRNVDNYLALIAKNKARRIIVKPGDRVPIKGFDAFVAMAAGKAITAPLKGAGQPNPACDTTQRKVWGLDDRGILDNHDTNENAMSIGLLVTYGKFRMYDPADLTWNKERELMCPVNRVGAVDLFMAANHGMFNGDSPVMVHALRPRVAIVGNGPKKGATAEVLQTMRSSPRLEDYWQMHYLLAGGEKGNVSADFIANLQEGPDGKWIKVSVQPSGAFTVTNSRNNFSKTYKPKK